MAPDTRAYAFRGILAKNGATFMKLVPNEYMVGAQVLGTESATSTVRNLPKPPAGARTALKRPPMSLPAAKPASHEGTKGADAANTAPRTCAVNWEVGGA